jgi:hypothetical protein
MNIVYRIFRTILFVGTGILLILSTLGWRVNSSAAQSASSSTTLVLSEHFDDGEISTNPTWSYNYPAFFIVDGQLHSDGVHNDGSDRYSNYYRTYPTFGASDYLEFSFRAKLKSSGNPQAGRGVKLLIIDASGYPCYELRMQNGYVDGFPINHNSLSFGYCANESLYDTIVSNFEPEYDRFYNLRAVRSNGEFSLFVDDVLIGQAPDPLGLTQFGSVFIISVGSIVIDDIEVVTGDAQVHSPEITGANMNIDTDIVGTPNGSYEELPYGFEIFIDGKGNLSTIAPEDVDASVNGTSLHVESVRSTLTGNPDEYRIFATGHFPAGQTPPLGNYTIQIRDTNGLTSNSFPIGLLEDYPRGAPFVVSPQHLSMITEPEPTFEWQLFETDYNGQSITPACGVMLYNPEYDYFTSLTPLGQTNLAYLGSYWHPAQPPALVPGDYSWVVGCDIGNVAPGFGFSYHRTVNFTVVPPNQPPTVRANGPFLVSEGGSSFVTATGSDPEGGSLAYAWDLDNNGTFETPGQNALFSAVGMEPLSSHPITVRVTDNGGLSATDQTVVNVGYNFTGFLQPVDNLPTLNMMKAGQGVAVKFSLQGYQGLDIFTAGYPTSSQVACGSTAEDAVEQMVTAGSSSLTYDSNTDQYIYIWKTNKTWAGTCRTLVIKLSDGTYHRANFKFK